MNQALTALAFLAVVGCGDDIAPRERLCGPVVVESQVSVPPGSFIEAEIEMQRASRAIVMFESTQALRYDVHIHVGDEVLEIDSGVAQNATIDFIAESSQPHFPLWLNTTDESAALTVITQLESGACWRSFL